MKSTVSNIGQGEYRILISGPFYKCDLYNDAGDVVLSHWLEQPQHLDNSTQDLDCMPLQYSFIAACLRATSYQRLRE